MFTFTLVHSRLRDSLRKYSYVPQKVCRLIKVCKANTLLANLLFLRIQFLFTKMLSVFIS